MFDFLKNKVVQIVALILFVVSAIVLVAGGFTKETLDGVLVAVIALVGAVSGLIALISSLIKKDK